MKAFLTSLFSGFLMLSAAPASAAIISVSPSAQNLTIGSSFEVELIISGLGAGTSPSIGTYDLDFFYNPSILNYTGSVFGDPILGNQLDLFGFGSFTDETPGAGFVNLFELSFDFPDDLNDLQADIFTLVTLSFDTLSAGFSSFDITLNALGDANGDSLLADLVSGSVIVNDNGTSGSVPEPATWLLLGVGALWFRCVKRQGNGSNS